MCRTRHGEDRRAERASRQAQPKGRSLQSNVPAWRREGYYRGMGHPPFMGLGTWAAFMETKSGAMVMGDTVLFEDEVNPAMSAALENGLSVTALHNHFFFDQPKVFFMHIEGEGSVEQLAKGVKKMYDTVKASRGP